MEMIKGIQGHGYYDELVVPIIENTAREYELTDSLAAAVRAPVRLAPCAPYANFLKSCLLLAREMGDRACGAALWLALVDQGVELVVLGGGVQIAAYPKATAVLVRNHGIYVWGTSWIHAKTQVTSPPDVPVGKGLLFWCKERNSTLPAWYHLL